MKGIARVAAALALMATIGFLAVGVSRSASAAQPASWVADGGSTNQGHDLTPIVLLKNGDVMAIGGFSGSSATTDVEILDHTSKQWSLATGHDVLPAGYGAASLVGAQATVLSGGDVLLSGGHQGSAAVTSAALWDSGRRGLGAGGSNWTLFTMSKARDEHVSVALPGSNKAVLVGGGCSGGTDTEVFTDNSNGGGSFASASNCSLSGNKFREQAAAVVTSAGDVIVTGGLAAEGTPSGCVAATNEVDVLPASTLVSGNGTWTSPAPPMAPAAQAPSNPPQPADNCPDPPNTGARVRHTATEVEAGGAVFVAVAGGAAQETFSAGVEALHNVQSSTEVYTATLTTLTAGQWQSGQPLPTARADLASAPLGAQVLIAGGRGLRSGNNAIDPADGTPGFGLADAQILDPPSRSLLSTTPMNNGRFNFTLTAVPSSGGQILAAGGFSGQSSGADVTFAQQAELFTPAVAPTPPPTTPPPSGTPGVTPTPRPTFNPGQHHLALSIPVVHAGAPLTVTANGLTPGQQVLLFLQPASVNPLQACGVGQKSTVTVPTNGAIASTIIVFGQGSPQLVVTLCVVAPPPGGPANAVIPQAVGRVALLVQTRGLEPPFIGSIG